MQQNNEKSVNGASVNGVSNKTKKANLILAIILGAFVLFGMASTFFMLSEKL